MATGSTTIRITNQSRDTVRELARETGLRQQEILDLAIEAYRRQLFLQNANCAFAALRSKSVAWGAEQAEREVWDRALGDGSRQMPKVGPKPLRGDVWLVDLTPTRGHEIRGTHPCVIVSVDDFHRGPGDLVVVLPATTTDTGIPFHVRIDPPEGEVMKPTFIKTEQPRCISTNGLAKHLGRIHPETLLEIDDRLRTLLDL
jgi:mRNA interferase MazF